ncbi:hypothetical protein J4733_28160 [Klebsiella pneumoniae]|uniref:Uncharacterized protein n=1 Tax=Klebsiella pneumoniae TaxID=573 RepID=A0A939NNE2_KLEPN|nr:hypothetical protein [Klebsiella pneumoniae]
MRVSTSRTVTIPTTPSLLSAKITRTATTRPTATTRTIWCRSAVCTAGVDSAPAGAVL